MKNPKLKALIESLRSLVFKKEVRIRFEKNKDAVAVVATQE